MAQTDYQSKIDEVLDGFRIRAMDAVKAITDLIDSDDERIRLDASKYTIKIVGAEVDQIKHSGTVQFEPVKFTREDEEGTE